MWKTIHLQCKFIIVLLLNVTYNFIPVFYLRNIYLYLFGIKIGDGSAIHRACKFFHLGKIVVGNNSVINFGCYLDNRRGIFIGNNVGIAHNCKIYTLGHDINDPHFKTKGSPVHINDNVFVFSNSLIMPGVTVKEGAIILAGSVVIKDVEPFTIVGGNPAKFIGFRNSTISYNQKYQFFFAL